MQIYENRYSYVMIKSMEASDSLATHMAVLSLYFYSVNKISSGEWIVGMLDRQIPNF